MQTPCFSFLFFKIFRIPQTEAVQAPNLSGVILLTGIVGIQKLYHFLFLKELGHIEAKQYLLHTIVILLLTKPYPNRYREAQLLTLGGRLRRILKGRQTKGLLRGILIYL